MRRKGLGVLAAFGMLFALLLTWTTPAYAATLTVGNGPEYDYADLDTAIANASDGDVIELHGDAQMTKGFSKSLTFTGDGRITSVGQLTAGGEPNFWVNNKNITFRGQGVSWDWTSGGTNWLMLNLSGTSTLNVEDGASVTFRLDSQFTGTRNAIYMSGTTAINVSNGSSLNIIGQNTKGYSGQGIQLETTSAQINVTGKSEFTIDGTNRGFVHSPILYVEDSEFTIKNCTANASNGGPFTFVNSTITFTDNLGHGISSGDLVIDNSDVIATGNGYCGIVVAGDLDIRNGSDITVSGNAWLDDSLDAAYAGFRLNGGSTSNTYHIDGTTTLTIQDNYNTGLDVRRGTLTIDDGAEVAIAGNSVTNTDMAGYGGGIYVGYSTQSDWARATIPSDALICNNHALNGGDDIYVAPGVEGARSSLTVYPVQDGRALDGIRLTASGGTIGSPVADDCVEAIDGWYYDGIDKNGDFNSAKRWEAHGSTYDEVYVEQYVAEGTTTVTGPLALKAAHGLGSVAVDPADITVYMGGDQGYEGVITDEDSGSYDASNSLPEPGFYFVLPEEINQAFATAGITTDGGAADLSQYMRIYTHGYDGGELNWKLEMYGATQSNGVNRQFIYRIVPDPTPGQEPVPVRLQFTSEDGSTTFTNDTFNPAQAGALHQRYTMRLYTELVDANQVVFEVEIDGTKYYNTMELQEGVLDVRYVTGDQDDVVTDVVNSEEELAAARVDNPDKAYAVMPDGTTYYINESQVDVTNSAAPSLLFDDLAGSDDTGVAADYPQQLANRALDVITETGASFEHPWYQAKYLDLVDANNGNVYLTTDQPVTVYWPYPAGTDQNTEFHLVHFADLDRDMNNGEISGQIDSSSANYVEVENTEHGIRFTTDGFSPFVLMWEGEGDGPAEPPVNAEPPASGTLTATGDNSLTAITVLGAAGGTCIAAAYVLRKRKAQ